MSQIHKQTEDVLNTFLSNQISDSSAKRYKYEILRFSEFLKYPDLALVKFTDILHYKETFKDRKPNTVAWKLKTLKYFFDCAKTLGVVPNNPLDKIKIPRPTSAEPESLTKEEAEALIKAPDRRTLIDKRDYAILNLFLSTGIRLNELTQLKQNDLLEKNNSYYIRVTGKGNTQRIIKVPVSVVQVIKEYRLKLKPHWLLHPALFLSTKSKTPKPVTQRAVTYLVRKYAKIAKIQKRVYPHILRHTCFTLELIKGANIKQIQEQAGHRSILTTSGYLHSLNSSAVDVNPLFHSASYIRHNRLYP